FHEGDRVSLARDQVDFRVTDPESMRHDVAPARQQVADRLLLPREAPPLALVLPIRRIAPQPALHGCKLIASPGASEPIPCGWCEFIARARRFHPARPSPPIHPAAWTRWRGRGCRRARADR